MTSRKFISSPLSIHPFSSSLPFKSIISILFSNTSTSSSRSSSSRNTSSLSSSFSSLHLHLVFIMAIISITLVETKPFTVVSTSRTTTIYNIPNNLPRNRVERDTTDITIPNFSLNPIGDINHVPSTTEKVQNRVTLRVISISRISRIEILSLSKNGTIYSSPETPDVYSLLREKRVREKRRPKEVGIHEHKFTIEFVATDRRVCMNSRGELYTMKIKKNETGSGSGERRHLRDHQLISSTASSTNLDGHQHHPFRGHRRGNNSNSNSTRRRGDEIDKMSNNSRIKSDEDCYFRYQSRFPQDDFNDHYFIYSAAHSNDSIRLYLAFTKNKTGRGYRHTIEYPQQVQRNGMVFRVETVNESLYRSLVQNTTFFPGIEKRLPGFNEIVQECVLNKTIPGWIPVDNDGGETDDEEDDLLEFEKFQRNAKLKIRHKNFTKFLKNCKNETRGATERLRAYSTATTPRRILLYRRNARGRNRNRNRNKSFFSRETVLEDRDLF